MESELTMPYPDRVPRLSVRALAKSYAGTRVLQPLDIEVHPGEVHALIGENGSGKSTFIKILAGLVTPDSEGAGVLIDDRPLDFGSPQSSYALGCRFVHQDLGLIDALSVMDNIMLNTGFPTRLGAISDRAARRSVGADLTRVGLEIDPQTLVRDLSPAQKTGVAIARALRPDAESAPKVLVFDEPTATLPGDEVLRLIETIKLISKSDVAVIYVTHRLDEVFEIAHNVTVLRNGYQVGRCPIEELTRDNLVNMLVGSEFDEISAVAEARGGVIGDTALEVKGLCAGVLEDISFSVRSGEVVGLAGITGSGRDSILSSIFGRIPRENGTVAVDGATIPSNRPDLAVSAGVAYVPPDRKHSGGVLTHSARENLTLADLRPVTSHSAVRRKLELIELKDWIARLAVRPALGFESPLATFSGGNQQKVIFAKWLRLKPKVFLLDEPTQGVDVNAKAMLHKELLWAASEGTAIVVSSTDVDELVALCDRVLVFRDGSISQSLGGSDLTIGKISRASFGSYIEVSP